MVYECSETETSMEEQVSANMMGPDNKQESK